MLFLYDQKSKYLENEKSFKDEIKNISNNFERNFIEVNKATSMEGESPTSTTSWL